MNLNNKELTKLQMSEYRKHGNSLNGAQLILMEHELKYMQELYSNKEIAEMILTDFDLYFNLSGELLRKNGWKV